VLERIDFTAWARAYTNGEVVVTLYSILDIVTHSKSVSRFHGFRTRYSRYMHYFLF